MSQRDAQISDLKSQLINQQNEINTLKKNLSSEVVQTTDKKDVHLAVIGDSIIKHIDANRICPDKQNIVKCEPGARIGDLKQLLINFEKEYRPDNLILCGGTNHLPGDSAYAVSHKMIKLAKLAVEKFPNSKIYMNSILPKFDDSFTEPIKEINSRVRRECRKINVDFIYNNQFLNGNEVNVSLLARDRLHLSRKGVAQLGSNFKYRIKKCNTLTSAV